MSDEIKAARERLRRLDSGEPYYEIYGCVPTMHGHQQRDEKRILDNDLAEHPADDDELLTAPFVESLGFRWCKLGYYWPSWSTALTLTGGDGDVELIGMGNVRLAKLRTRGDLRLLSRALSIPVTEPGAS